MNKISCRVTQRDFAKRFGRGKLSSTGNSWNTSLRNRDWRTKGE